MIEAKWVLFGSSLTSLLGIFMTITYLGHSCFKLKGKTASVITDPYGDFVGFKLPLQKAEVVTVSHDHQDHNAVERVSGTELRPEPFIIREGGEYEVNGISVFGIDTFHDNHGGVERGKNLVFKIIIDGVKVCHLGDLGHLLTEEQANQIGMIDVLLLPIGGETSVSPEEATKIARFLEPSYVIPMHYRTEFHNQDVFAGKATLEDFLKDYDTAPKLDKKLKVELDRLPEETELYVLEKTS